MRAMAVGLVTATNTYEKDGHVIHTVSVGLGRQAFNVNVESVLDWFEGDSVCLVGDFGVGKTGMFCMEARIHLASENDRAMLGIGARRRPVASTSSKPTAAELEANK